MARRELDVLELLIKQIEEVKVARDALLAAQRAAAPAPTAVAMLLELKGVGPGFAGALWSEGLFRHFDNRRQVAAYAGLAPTPWQSGSVAHEQGVSKAGNPRLRATIVEMAWLWLRYQPASARPMVPRPGQAHRRPHEEGGHRGTCQKAAGRALEVRDRGRRHRGRRDEARRLTVRTCPIQQSTRA